MNKDTKWQDRKSKAWSAGCLTLLTEVLLLAFSLGGLGTDLFVILLKGSKILTSLREFTFLHSLTDIPVNEGTLGVHKIELVVDTRKSLGNGSGVGNHAHGTLDTGQITSGDNGRGLVVNTTFESGGAPVNELNGTLGLDGGNRRVDILGDDVTTEHKTTSHEFTVTRVALGHHVGGLEDRVGDLGNRKLLVVSLLSRDDRGVRGKHEMDTRVRDQIGLEFRDINVQSTIETKRGGQRRHNLGDQTIQIGVGRTLNVQVTTADIVKGFVIQAKGAISVLQKRVRRQHMIVGFHDGGGNLRGGGHGERQLGLTAVIDRKTLQKKGSETRSGSSSGGMEYQKTLKTGTVISQLSDSVQDKVDNFFTNGVVTTGVVIGGIFLTRDDLLRVIQLTVGSGTDFVTHSGLQIKVDGTGNVLSGTGLRKKSVERVITATDSLVGRHLTIGLDSVL
jgi:hypothetical protein